MFRYLCSKISRQNLIWKRNKYYVLIPEIPEDTAETNSLLKTNSYPKFAELDEKKCINAIARLLIDYEAGIYALSEKLEDTAYPRTPENVIVPLERLSVPLDFAWATFKILYTLKPHDKIAEAYFRVHHRIIRLKREQFLSPTIFQAFKDLKKNDKDLSEAAKRVVSKHILESRLSGLELPKLQAAEFQNNIVKLNGHKTTYRYNLNECTSNFSQPLTTEDVIGFPEEFLSQISSDPSNPRKSPWYVTMAPTIYQQFMEYSENRSLRWNLYNAKSIRASAMSGHSLNNSKEIEEIRNCRRQQATMLGYNTYADLSMETKMAGNIENVMSMITTLKVKSQATLAEDLENLQAFATDNGFPQKLELWDVPYWQRRHKESLFSNVNKDVRLYFPLPTVLKGLFDLCKKLFRISIVEATAEVDVWCEDVKFYKIFDENSNHLASFYTDLHERPENKLPGTWMELGRNRSDIVGVAPLSYLVSSFSSPPQSKKPATLSFKDLHTLFEKFGHVLQHSLSTCPYNDVAGLTNLEWDVVNVCPLVMSSLLTHYDTASSLSCHVDSGDKIPGDIYFNLVKERNYMSSLRLAEELYLSALDLELYSRKDFWQEIARNAWTEFMPFPFEKNQAQPCSFPQIFCDDYPAAYFSNLWAEMIAADVFNAFQETGLNNDDISHIGRRFRETYLSLGGACHPSEVFRRFRGRDPCIEAMLKSYGLVTQTKTKPKDRTRTVGH